MYERLAILFVDALYLYGAFDLVFAVAFVTIGVKRLDPQAKCSTMAFRVLLFPGSMAFWPLLLRRSNLIILNTCIALTVITIFYRNSEVPNLWRRRTPLYSWSKLAL
jgi:hypothetical protein